MSENNKTKIRSYLMDADNWFGFEEGFEGRNYNHHWKNERDFPEEEIKIILVEAYKGELEMEFDGERITIVAAETSRHREGIELDLCDWDWFEEQDEFGYEEFDKIITDLFAPQPDFLEAVNS
jgi:hypothetical protein